MVAGKAKVSRHVRADDKLAAALYEILRRHDSALADTLRRRRVDASEIIRLFHLDHNVFHSWADSSIGVAPDEINKWWNLTWRMEKDHIEKTKVDQGIIAKARRKDEAKRYEALTEAQKDVQRILLGKRPRHKKPKSRIQSRGFPKKPKKDKLPIPKGPIR